ncbi:unnamed protein product [Blepharisma stoltei]|uniref:Uncharacterized protein n=1 Tax=Blepharisma stoltei TaxID=1481888 RepID=A0AAU9IM41_9CILI|nr:unnamed protein product [Blepharisma stoltei]
MSLSYHSEHLAWQQRINQEKTRASDFNKTFSNFSTFNEALQTGKTVFPKANQLDKPINYNTLRFNLAYSFGGTKPIRHALQDQDVRHSLSPSKRVTTDSFNRSSIKTASESPRKNASKDESSPKKLKTLKEINPELAKLEEELTEMKLNASKSSFQDAGDIYMRDLEKKLSKERKKRIQVELEIEKIKIARKS